MIDSKLQHLIDLAGEPSSERRRELLREVTDLFFTSADPSQPSELSLFDDILTQLSGEMEVAVRAELADRMADADQPPRALLRRLNEDPALARLTPSPPTARSVETAVDQLVGLIEEALAEG